MNYLNVNGETVYHNKPKVIKNALFPTKHTQFQ